MGFNYVIITCIFAKPSLSVVTLVLLLSFLGHSCAFNEERVSFNTFTVSSFSYPQTTIRAFELRYIRVVLPPWFSSMSLSMLSDADLGTENIEYVPKSKLPIICFRDGSPPLPDASGSLMDSGHSVLFPVFNSSFEAIQALHNGEQCYPMQKNFTVILTNEQISPGVWYFGLFNGIGRTRTQSKMINRRPSYWFSANISVEGCTTSTMWGQYCNQTIESLSCSPIPTNSYDVAANFSQPNIIKCKNNFATSCIEYGEPKVYTLDIMGLTEELHIIPRNITFNGVSLICIIRHGAMPSTILFDYLTDITKDGPLVIRSPKIGRWFIAFLSQGSNVKVCYSIESNVLQCPLGKTGPNCTWENYLLQTVLRRGGSVPFESHYLPVGREADSSSSNFPLEPILTNISYTEEPNKAWTYLSLDIPQGAAGGNIHIRISSDIKIAFEIYARYGGYPSLDTWDYYYANKTMNSDGSMFFKLYNSSRAKVDFYILSIKEGMWSFGIRGSDASSIIASQAPTHQTMMSISLERCPKGCSSHGQCKYALDASGLALYSFCSCDRNHGGFDCSIEIVSHRGHIWQSISLIASNVAAIFPAFWALRQKALAEWVIFTSSGISSGLYHACDVGTWCSLPFNVLQFLDFWLSFMAVVSTFVYLATIDEAFKRAIHAVVAIITAIMAISKATSSSNIIIVIAIGTLGLIAGLLVEYSTKLRSFSVPIGLCLNMLVRWEAVKGWAHSVVKTILERFRWGFVLAGFAALALAAISWKLETSESYWIWHSIWHVTIYACSFFFLCSKVDKAANNEDERPPDRNYELTRQDSIPRGE